MRFGLELGSELELGMEVRVRVRVEVGVGERPTVYVLLGLSYHRSHHRSLT